MPVVTVGFHFRPVGFFTENPALDIAPDGNQYNGNSIIPKKENRNGSGSGIEDHPFRQDSSMNTKKNTCCSNGKCNNNVTKSNSSSKL